MTAPSAAIVVHGGAGAGEELSDGCRRAADAAARALVAGDSALAAAIAAVVVMEDDGRFNAGSGASLGLDGQTVELDASLMDTCGTLAAVAALRSVKNPVLVARDVARTPHYLLAGEGAQSFARMMGHGPHDVITGHQRRKHAELLKKMATAEQPMAGVDNQQFARYWNYAGSPTFGSHGCDTVGAVVRGADGHFAVAASTGGSAPSLLGRVGDTPLVGCGFYAGPEGAVAATGIGEYIIRTMLALTVYRWIADGMDLHQALRQGVALVPHRANTGLIAVSKTQSGWHANTSTPFADAALPDYG